MSAPNSDNQNPEFLEDVAAKAAALLIVRGLSETAAIEVGAELASEIRRAWGGAKIYIPMGASQQLSVRDQEIYAKFNGRNLRALSREYGLSEERIRQVLVSVRIERRRRGTDS